MLTLWHRPYTIRRFITENTSETLTVKMNVQPAKTDTHLTEEAGDMVVKKLISFGRSAIYAADKNTGIMADRLLYNELWYECLSSLDWTHTPLRHFEATWVLMDTKEQEEYEPEPEFEEPENESNGTIKPPESID